MALISKDRYKTYRTAAGEKAIRKKTIEENSLDGFKGI